MLSSGSTSLVLGPGRGGTSVLAQETADRRDQVGRFEWLRDVHLEPGR